MTQLKNDRFLRALLRQPVDRTPVWIMRQAGRYLPEYRATRAQAGDFLSLCKNTELACEVTLQPLRRFPLDAAILFSDILTIPDGMGLGLYFAEGEGPRFRKRLESEQDVERLPVISTSRDLPYVTDAVAAIRRELNGQVPLIGFSGSPWTLATYMIEGGSSRDFTRSKYWVYEKPEWMHQLLEKLSLSIIDYLNAQIDAGAQAVQIFDSWGGALGHSVYQTFSLAYMNKIIAGLKREAQGREVPVILFTKGGGQWLEAIADSGCSAAGVDWTTHLGQARARVGDRIALQGNLDPAVLRASTEVVCAEVDRVLAEFGAGSGHVFNLGHGITPDIDPGRVADLVERVHSMSEKYHQD
ncbi:MAG: uroporphyrinogen decarboxylase [Porticoccaceae bacterium]